MREGANDEVYLGNVSQVKANRRFDLCVQPLQGLQMRIEGHRLLLQPALVGIDSDIHMST